MIDRLGLLLALAVILALLVSCQVPLRNGAETFWQPGESNTLI